MNTFKPLSPQRFAAVLYYYRKVSTNADIFSFTDFIHAGNTGSGRTRISGKISILSLPFSFLPPAYVVRGKVIFILGNVYLFTFGGGSQVQVGGIPGPGPGRGGPRSRWGGPRSRWGGPRSRSRWGVPGPGPGGGVPSLRSRGGYLVSGPGGYPVSVKGKIFDTRFGLIHVQTGEKNFSKGPPPQ